MKINKIYIIVAILAVPVFVCGGTCPTGKCGKTDWSDPYTNTNGSGA